MISDRLRKTELPIFIATIDVEADNVWGDPTNLSTKNLKILPDFQRLCNKYRIVPTYLLSFETLADKNFILFLRESLNKGECEMGIHPHVWTIPPFGEEKAGIDTPIVRFYQSMLDEAILIEKLDTLQGEIQEKIGVIPKSHRAGRWGLCLRTVKWLEKNGYISDTSVVPYKYFRDSTLALENSPNYYRAFPYPYRMSNHNLLEKGSLELIEVPTTNTNCFINPSIVKITDLMRSKRFGTRLKKILDKLSMYPMELRPYPEYLPGTLPKIAKVAIKKRLPIINLMFHSSELMTGGSPYSSDEMKTKQIWKHIEELFSFVRDKNFASLGLSDSVKYLKKCRYFQE